MFRLEFTKMHGLGNDFILMDDRSRAIAGAMDYSRLAAALCDRHFGIGGDGIILAVPPAADGDIGFVIYNADGSRAGMCGNGMRCFARYLYENKLIPGLSFRIETDAGIVIPEVSLDAAGQVGSVTVDMGEPILDCARIPFVCQSPTAVEEPIETVRGVVTATMVNMGNPHAVVFVPDLADVDVAGLGRILETHERFPEKTNVEFVAVQDDQSLRMKVWERGAGATLACGTGACAVLVAGLLTGRCREQARILLDGGELDIRWDPVTRHIHKSGPAARVFDGWVDIRTDRGHIVL